MVTHTWIKLNSRKRIRRNHNCIINLGTIRLSIHEHKRKALNNVSFDRIRRRSDCIIGFIAPVIGPNNSKKLTLVTWLTGTQ